MSIDSIIQLVIAVVTACAVVVALYGNRQAYKTAKEDRESNQRMAEEERRIQSRPVLAPGYPHEGVPQAYDMNNQPQTVKLWLSNLGSGPAFSVDALIYEKHIPRSMQYVALNYGPLAQADRQVIHFQFKDCNIRGEEILYALSDRAGVEMNDITMTHSKVRLILWYRDIFGIIYISVYDLDHTHDEWHHLLSTQSDQDLKELMK